MRGDAESTGNSNLQGITQQYAVFGARNWSTTQVQVLKHTKPNLSKPIVSSYLTLNIAYELITPKLLFLVRIIPKLFLPSCPPSAANTMLAICYTCCGIVL